MSSFNIASATELDNLFLKLKNAENKNSAIQYENKIGLARRLAQLADINGFLFLVDEVVRLEKAPYTIQGTIDVHFINTAEALKAIDRIVFMVIDPKYDDQTRFHESARSIIME